MYFYMIKYTVYMHGFVVYLSFFRKITVEGSKVFHLAILIHVYVNVPYLNVIQLFPQAFLYVQLKLLQSPCKLK